MRPPRHLGGHTFVKLSERVSTHRGYPAFPGTAVVTRLKGCRPACGIHLAQYVWIITLGVITVVGLIVIGRL